MSSLERLQQVPLFSGLSLDDLKRVCADVVEQHFAAGEALFREGEPGDAAFVITSGEVEVHKATEGNDIVVAVRGPDDVVGEMALLRSAPRWATVQARTKVSAIRIPRSGVDTLLTTSTEAARSLVETLTARMDETRERLRHHERMAQLGTLTAGVAHELNNPAAAVQRAGQQLRATLDELAQVLAAAAAHPGVLEAGPLLIDSTAQPQTDPLAASEAEEALETWLADRGVDESWRIAADLAQVGVSVDHLDKLSSGLESGTVALAARLVAAVATARRLTDEVAMGAGRLSDLVGKLRTFSYLDRAPVTDVDVHRGLDDTVTLMGHVLHGIRVERDYDPELPGITALGAELNQVWTNLIHNAADALHEAETPDATITLRTRAAEGKVIVEVEDNGPGIPAEAQHRVFDAFYTTKPPGKGTGLGLQTSFKIVVQEHHGDLRVESRPGRTVFRAELPVTGPSATTEESEKMAICDDLEDVENTPKPEGVCDQCVELGDTWVHLRFCVTCGQIGCCDSSKNKHATRHAREVGHPVLRTKEPGENWAWCVEHEMGMQLP